MTHVVFPHDVGPDTVMVKGCLKLIVCCCGGALGGAHGGGGGACGGAHGGGGALGGGGRIYPCCSSICLLIVYPLVKVLWQIVQLYMFSLQYPDSK